MYLGQREPGIAEVVLDRPPANPFGMTELKKLRDILDQVEKDDLIKVLVIRSTSRMFCAGADIQMMGKFSTDPAGPKALADFAADLQGVFRKLRRLPCCTIAAIAGVATGGGFELALSCDIRVIGETVRCGLPEILLGLIPAAGGTQLMSEIAGKGAALRLILSGELITGEEARRLNLVQYAVANDTVDAFSFGLAQTIARQPAEAIKIAKRCISSAGSEAGYAEEISGTLTLQQSNETKALIANFLASRSAKPAAY